MHGFRLRGLIACISVVAALVLIAHDADARAGGGTSMGSRGARTFSAPPTTRTAPTTAAPMERSTAQPSTAPAPTTSAPGGVFGRPGGFFGGGLLGGLAAGFLGAGLFGLLSGYGFLGGLGSFAGFLGLLFQIALIVIVARLLWAWWQSRNQPAFAGGTALRDLFSNGLGSRASSAGTGTAAGTGAAGGLRADTVTITPADYNAFEQRLGEIQNAYSAEDISGLRQRVTPEMLSYFSEQLAQNASRGVVNRITDVKLLQGDLAEAWREADSEYATVAMRYALKDSMVDRASGRVVEGNAEHPQDVTELWTFRRARGGDWLLSAIQQT
jgi:predicted lipid-binding transport protein (Tim44 family)